jgi:hypothetical protein
MTGNSTTVLLGMAAIALTLPLGLLVLFLVNRGIERAHPGGIGRAPVPRREASAQVPGQRAASAAEGRGGQAPDPASRSRERATSV